MKIRADQCRFLFTDGCPADICVCTGDACKHYSPISQNRHVGKAGTQKKMTKEELRYRINSLLPHNAYTVLSESEVICPGTEADGGLRFRIEMFLPEHIFSREHAKKIYEALREILPEADRAVFEEKQDMEWEYNLQFDIIGINAIPDEEDSE